jgi:cell division protein FtsB
MKRPGTVILFILFGVIFTILLIPRVMKIRSLETRSESLEAELKALRKNNQELETELRLLRDDPVYLEKVARQQFNKAKQGEIVYKVVRQGERTS